jgi:hypothetical protein
MKHRSYGPVRLEYSRALRRMFQGSRLVRTNGKRVEYAVSPGGPISDVTAQKILEHNLCRPADAGLLTDRPQSWEFTDT